MAWPLPDRRRSGRHRDCPSLLASVDSSVVVREVEVDETKVTVAASSRVEASYFYSSYFDSDS